LRAAAALIEQAGGALAGIGVLLELIGLDGRRGLDALGPLHALASA
jgi:hypothetical protein